MFQQQKRRRKSRRKNHDAFCFLLLLLLHTFQSVPSLILFALLFSASFNSFTRSLLAGLWCQWKIHYLIFAGFFHHSFRKNCYNEVVDTNTPGRRCRQTKKEIFASSFRSLHYVYGTLTMCVCVYTNLPTGLVSTPQCAIHYYSVVSMWNSYEIS